MDEFENRHAFAVDLCRQAGEVALGFFAARDDLQIDQKGAQDWVSDADRSVEVFIRERLHSAFPDDGIFGEEHDDRLGTSGFNWVIDPIDGTTNFVNGIPNWTIVLAGVSNGITQIGVIHDPNVDETFAAKRGGGAMLNGKPMHVAAGKALEAGTVAVGYSNRVEAANVAPVVLGLLERGAMFHRNASGALSLAYVSSGRLLGYVEEHMNAWDCLAGQLLVHEAGGMVEDQNADDMIRNGGRVIAATPDVFEELRALALAAWD